MQISNQRKRTSWYKAVEDSTDPAFALAILTTAEHWALQMEARLDQKEEFNTAANETFQALATKSRMYKLHQDPVDMMVEFLEACWRHGSKLRRWYGQV